jgi:glycosyltransferase involved in cell wall biosynthesis
MLGTWTNQVDAFIALSDFQRGLMSDAGLPAQKLHVKPNFYPGLPTPLPWESRMPYVVFAGRLSVEKGLESLLQAWRAWGPSAPELRVVGDGDLRPVLERQVGNAPVRFLGQVDGAEAQRQIAGARLLVLPSECYEGFPMVVREAFAFGTPVAVSNIGPLPSIVRHRVNGIVFEPANPASLMHQVQSAWKTTGLLEKLGIGSRLEFEGRYTEEANYTKLIDIYKCAIAVSRGLN